MASPELLSTWYSSLRPRSIDLIGDYAGAEFFILDGDSLLRRAFSGGKIDFDEGFQLLHAVYAVERFLYMFRGKRCNFAVVFFDGVLKLLSLSSLCSFYVLFFSTKIGGI